MMELPDGPLWAETLEGAVAAALRHQPRVWHDVAAAHAGGPLAVLAAMVVSCDADDGPGRRYLCVSLGSGTRCCGAEADFSFHPLLSAVTVGDGHAEVLARRGCVAFFLDAAAQVLAGAPHPLLSVSGERGTALCWREGLAAHLVVSQWPCGFLARAATKETGGRLLLRGPCAALPVSAEAAAVPVFGHALAPHKSAEDAAPAAAHAARVKPGRGAPNLHMSCSDKVWRWATAGIQGERRRAVLPHLPLHSLHVAAEGDAEAAAAAMRCVHSLRSPDSSQRCLLVSAMSTAALWGETGSGDASPPAAPSSSSSPGGEAADSSYSRAAWLAHGEPVGRKRSRGGAPTGFSWATAGRMAVNTKCGLPQGFPAKALPQRYPELGGSGAQDCVFLGDLPATSRLRQTAAREFPLSRAWMFFRVAALQPATAAMLRDSRRQAQRLGDSNSGPAGTPRPGAVWTLKPRLGDTLDPSVSESTS
eukprot:gene4160-3001_t